MINLPPEILLQILSSFCSHCRNDPVSLWNEAAKSVSPSFRAPIHKPETRTLHSLCLVSKRLQAVAQPLLHHDFIPGHQAPQGDTLDRKLYLFVRTLLRRRDLASQVRRAFIPCQLLKAIGEPEDVIDAIEAASLVLQSENGRLGSEQMGQDLSSVGQPSIRTLHELRRREDIPEPHRSRLAERCLARNLVAIAIALLPNLEYLGLAANRWDLWPDVDASPSIFPALGISALPLKTFETGLCLSRCVDFLNISKQIETLHIDQSSRFPEVSDLSFPKLKTLRITRSIPSPTHLEAILASCGNGLETFAYEGLGPPFRISGTVLFGNPLFFEQFIEVPKVLVPNLERHCKMLKTLHLDYRRSASVSSLPKLREFHMLRHLFIGHYSTAYEFETSVNENRFDDFLPPSLETLSIASLFHDPEMEYITELMSYMAEIKLGQSGLANLKRVTCDLRCRNIESIAASGRILSSCGVDFVYKTWTVYDMNNCLQDSGEEGGLGDS